MAKKVYRSKTSRMLGGVCGGIADYFNVDVVIVRLLWVLAALAEGIEVIVYILAWVIIPEESYVSIASSREEAWGPVDFLGHSAGFSPVKAFLRLVPFVAHWGAGDCFWLLEQPGLFRRQ